MRVNLALFFIYLRIKTIFLNVKIYNNNLCPKTKEKQTINEQNKL